MKMSQFLQAHSLHDSSLKKIIYNPQQGKLTLNIKLSDSIDSKDQAGILVCEEVNNFSTEPNFTDLSILNENEKIDVDILKAKADVFPYDSVQSHPSEMVKLVLQRFNFEKRTNDIFVIQFTCALVEWKPKLNISN